MGGKPTTPFWDEENNSLQLLSKKQDLQKIGPMSMSREMSLKKIRGDKFIHKNSPKFRTHPWESICNK